MRILTNIVLLAVLGFVVFAAVTQYKNTDPSTSPPQRIIAALGLAIAGVAAAALAWFHSAPQ